MLSWNLAAVPLLILLNAFFVAAEYALVAIRPVQIERMRRTGRRAAAAAMVRLKAKPAAALGAIQVCITMTNLLIGWIGEPAMSQLLYGLLGPLGRALPPAVFTGISVAISFVVVTLLTVVFSELLPKAMTLKATEPLAALTAVPVLVVRDAVRPLVWVMNKLANLVMVPLRLGRIEEIEQERVTAEEVRLVATQAAEQGAVSGRERSLILNALALGRRAARDIMVPRVRVQYLDLKRSMDENRRVLNEYLHTRMPLCDGGMDKVVGMIPTKEFLAAYNEAGDTSVLQLIAKPATFAPDTVSLDRLMLLFDEHKTQFVILADEHGGVAGIVTLADVVDELIGDPRTAATPTTATLSPAAATAAAAAAAAAAPPASGDGEAVPAPAAIAPDGPFVVAGDFPIHDLARRLGRDEWGQGQGVVTVGGLVAAHLGRLPAAGDTVRLNGVQLHVTEADPRAARRVEVSLVPEPTEPHAAPPDDPAAAP